MEYAVVFRTRLSRPNIQYSTPNIEGPEYAAVGGTLVNRLFLRRDVETIFKYRETARKERFGQGHKQIRARNKPRPSKRLPLRRIICRP